MAAILADVVPLKGVVHLEKFANRVWCQDWPVKCWTGTLTSWGAALATGRCSPAQAAARGPDPPSVKKGEKRSSPSCLRCQGITSEKVVHPGIGLLRSRQEPGVSNDLLTLISPLPIRLKGLFEGRQAEVLEKSE